MYGWRMPNQSISVYCWQRRMQNKNDSRRSMWRVFLRILIRDGIRPIKSTHCQWKLLCIFGYDNQRNHLSQSTLCGQCLHRWNRAFPSSSLLLVCSCVDVLFRCRCVEKTEIGFFFLALSTIQYGQFRLNLGFDYFFLTLEIDREPIRRFSALRECIDVIVADRI